MKKRMVKMESLFTSTWQLSQSSLDEEKLEERRRREREEERESCWDDEWTQMSSSLSYKPTFCIEPPSYFSNYNSSQMNGHLNQFTPNGIVTFKEVNVLLEIYVWVSRVSVFDKIRVISYLRKSPYIAWFSLKPFQVTHNLHYSFL